MKTIIKLAAVASLLLSVTACESTASQPAAPIAQCSTVNAVNLETAVTQAKANLDTGECSHRFAEYFDSLITSAKGDPKAENKRTFNDFLGWSHQMSIISRKDAVTYFNQYFGERFVSLNDTYNTCSQGTNQNQVFSALDKELLLKKAGILDVTNDKDLFNQVAKQKADLEAVLEATWMACEAS